MRYTYPATMADILPFMSVDRIYAITSLITAVTVLIKLFLVDRKVASAKLTTEETNSRVGTMQGNVETVRLQTNGRLEELKKHILELEAHIANLEKEKDAP